MVKTDRRVSRNSDAAFRQYFSDRKAGVKSTNRFFANLVQVPASEVKAALSDVSREVTYFPVKYDADIKSVLEAETSRPLAKGSAFFVEIAKVVESSRIAAPFRR